MNFWDITDDLRVERPASPNLGADAGYSLQRPDSRPPAASSSREHHHHHAPPPTMSSSSRHGGGGASSSSSRHAAPSTAARQPSRNPGSGAAAASSSSSRHSAHPATLTRQPSARHPGGGGSSSSSRPAAHPAALARPPSRHAASAGGAAASAAAGSSSRRQAQPVQPPQAPARQAVPQPPARRAAPGGASSAAAAAPGRKKPRVIKKKCVHCNQELRSGDMARHVRSAHAGNATIKCPDCNALFSNMRSQAIHCRRVHGKAAPLGQTSSQPGACATTVRTHNKSAKAKCCFCNVQFSSRKQRAAHFEQMHRGQQVFRCSYLNCPAEFKTQFELTSHMNLCSAARPKNT